MFEASCSAGTSRLRILREYRGEEKIVDYDRRVIVGVCASDTAAAQQSRYPYSGAGYQDGEHCSSEPLRGH
ncbi:hypothetical protein [Mycobacterium ostraviense]|uniref:hypothetical protein n=1 Tax=Mycobacterium ostraviense TaxID=2738409 RepID=UPI000A43287B|nr:hypothetical protein [Mycobacterium ostraviense]UGT90191.1 hypothetical protein LTS72_17695 [Mycobacterium ostraviense]